MFGCVDNPVARGACFELATAVNLYIQVHTKK